MKEFSFVEIQETHLAAPGMGTVRRWRREAPQDFEFALLAPREIGQEGFRGGKIVETALAGLLEIAAALDARIAVFVSPPELAATRANKAAVKEFLAGVRERFGEVVWEAPPTWDADEAAAIALGARVTPARDPLAHGTLDAKVAYYRMPGPAGHKSRYEDPAIEKLAALALEANHERARYVFTNVDMFADAKRLRKALKI